uniref:Putative secreted protein n=1 Tax=Amblyomma triste TaxID=251400 RepID=A0A023G9Y9_AMBTT
MNTPCFIAVIFFATADQTSAAVNQPQPRTTVACVPPYEGGGYARSYSYKCTLRNGTYPNNVPCLPLTHGGKPSDQAGLCQTKCKPYYDLDPLLKPCVFLSSLKKCEDKEHTAKTPLDYCRYYCQKKGQWYFGNYKNGGTSLCRLPTQEDPDQLGLCCNGECVKPGTCKS